MTDSDEGEVKCINMINIMYRRSQLLISIIFL